MSGLIEKETNDASSEDGSQINSAAEDGNADYSGDESSSQLKLQRVTTTSSARSKKSTAASTSSKKTNKLKWPNA